MFILVAIGLSLTDKDIDAFQQLVTVRTAYPNVKGLQTPLLQQCNKFQTFSKGPMLQILHEKLRKHWVLVALRTEAEQPVVEVYDSVYRVARQHIQKYRTSHPSDSEPGRGPK